jgi:hypothetical protein
VLPFSLVRHGKGRVQPETSSRPDSSERGLPREYASLPPQALSPYPAGSLKSSENWVCFVKQPIGKYQSISVEVLILRRRHQRLFQPFPKIAFSCFCLK